MRRSGALGSLSNTTRTQIPGFRTAAAAAPTATVRYVANITGTGLNWTDGTSAPLLVDVAPGDNTTFYQQTAGAAQTAWVIGLYDLGTARVVTRVRFEFGTANGNTYIGPTTLVEASNDGTTWVNAYTGGPPASDVGTGTFAWAPERDITQITTTAYRYWRVGVQDVNTQGNPDARLSDFRIYVAGNLVL